MSKKEKKEKFYAERLRSLIALASEAGFIQWKSTSDPLVHQNYDNGKFRGEWRGYETKIGEVTVKTAVRFKEPEKNDHDLVWTLEISKGDEKIVVSTDTKIIPGLEDGDGYLQFFCERIQRISEDRDLVATLTREPEKFQILRRYD